MKTTMLMAPMLMANLLFSKVAYNKVKHPSIPSSFKTLSGFLIQFFLSPKEWNLVQHDIGTIYPVIFVGKIVSYFLLLQSEYPSTPQHFS